MTHPIRGGKSALAMHLTEEHPLPGQPGRVHSVIYPPLSQLRRLGLEELTTMHASLHRPDPVRLEQETRR